MKLQADSPHVSEMRPSPNFGDRRSSGAVCVLVLHYTGMKSGAAAVERLCDSGSQVSSHYLVHEDGRILQMVSEEKRAWHAGISCWRGIRDINSVSLGIEIVNSGHDHGLPSFPEGQIDAVATLIKDIMLRHPIACRDVVGHSDIAHARKLDPGERFPWQRLAQQGAAIHVEASPVQDGDRYCEGDEGTNIRRMQQQFQRVGYCLPVDGVFGRATRECVTAFQRRFRPMRIDGIADVSTRNTLTRLLDMLDMPETTGWNRETG